MTDGRECDEQEVYQIQVEGALDRSWSDWFNGMAVTFEEGLTTLTGAVDQSALHGILARIRDLNMKLISVIRVEAKKPKSHPQQGGE